MFNYYIGLDLGQSNDYTALTVVEEPLWIPDDHPAWMRDANGQSIKTYGWVSPADLMEKRVRVTLPGAPVLALKHLHRFERGTSYPVMVKHVAEFMRRAPLA